MKYLVSLLILGLYFLPGLGQCNDALVEYAMARTEPHSVFIREFRAKLPAGKLKNPLPISKFSTYLQERNLYVFHIVSDSMSGSEAILQLFDKGQEIASVVDNRKSKSGSRVFVQALHSGYYQVVISFRDGKSGCAVGILSLAPAGNQDSLQLTKHEEPEVLYLNLENPVSIETDKEDSDSIIFETDNGTIREIKGNYFLVPVLEGTATLKVVIINRDGKVKEEAKSDFLVKRLPAPSVSMYGMAGGFISTSALQLSEGLDMAYPVEYENFGYSIQDFEVRIGDKRMTNTGKQFNQSIKQWLISLRVDDKIVIDQIHIHSPGGQIITIAPIAFIVR